LELLSVAKVLHIFAKDRVKCTILLRVDKSTAIAYVNRYRGCRSYTLHSILKRIWKFCEQRKIRIFASYISSTDNFVADAQSRITLDETDWKLEDSFFKYICTLFGVPALDLFASYLTTQCTKFYSWLPDPNSSVVDAFTFKCNEKSH